MRYSDFADVPLSTYGAIVADPPWRFETRSPKGRGRSPDGWRTANGNMPRQGAPRHYETMRVSEICAIPVNDVAADDCALFLWAIDPMLPAAIEVGERWGFTFKTVAFTWAKTTASGGFHVGLGYWTRGNPECCLLFTKGRPKRLSAAVRQFIAAPRREHSRKPDAALAGVEALVPGPYLEMFCREPRDGWDAWGNQLDRFDEQTRLIA